MKATLVAIALIAGIACVQAAGGIKGRQPAEDTQQRVQAVKGLRPPSQQQQYLPPPPPAPQPIALAPQPIIVPQQAIKAGPGQVTPVFNAIRVQPPPLPAPLPAPQSIQQQIQQQQEQVQVQEPEIVQQQQQLPAQLEEIDPNAAAQDSAPAIIAPARQGPAAAASEEEANPRPEPYSFQYAFDSGDSATSGSSTREESQDASGRVTGK